MGCPKRPLKATGSFSRRLSAVSHQTQAFGLPGVGHAAACRWAVSPEGKSLRRAGLPLPSIRFTTKLALPDRIGSPAFVVGRLDLRSHRVPEA